MDSRTHHNCVAFPSSFRGLKRCLYGVHRSSWNCSTPYLSQMVEKKVEAPACGARGAGRVKGRVESAPSRAFPIVSPTCVKRSELGSHVQSMTFHHFPDFPASADQSGIHTHPRSCASVPRAFTDVCRCFIVFQLTHEGVPVCSNAPLLGCFTGRSL